MRYLRPLELSFFAMESPSRPMHAGAVMLFEPPADSSSESFAKLIVSAFRAARPVSPWDQRPALVGLTSPPHWETVDATDPDYHVRHIAVPAPGSMPQLMDVVASLYAALLDRSRPLWEAYVIEGLADGRVAVFMKAHHALADGVGGLKMFYGSLSQEPNDDPRPVWAASAERDPARDRNSSRSGLAAAANRVSTLAGVTRQLVKLPAGAVRLAREGTAPPFRAAKTPTAGARITSARSFGVFDLPLAEVRQVGKAFGGTVNDVLLSVCDDAMQRYVDETGGAGSGRMVVLLPVSTRSESDAAASNAAGATLLTLGDPEAPPTERLAQVVDVTRRMKSGIRRSSPLAFQVQTLALLAAMELREQLPVGRGWVPNIANFTLSNVSAAPKPRMFLGPAKLVGFYATPIVSGSQAANFTVIPYHDTLCVGVGAARNIVRDAGRLAELAAKSFDDLRAATPQPAKA